MSGIQNLADFRVTLDGQDLGLSRPNSSTAVSLTGKIAPRLLSLTLTERRGGEADQLDIVIHDHDGKMAIPKKGAVLRVSLGWKGGAGVRAGLVDKGSFKVDEREWGGPPDTITIRARSADFTAGYRIRKERSHRDTTLGKVIGEIASANGLTARVAPELASIEVPVLGQDERSDMALVRALGRKHDAVATVKGGKLIFAPIGKGETATGKPIPSIEIVRGHGDQWLWREVEREQYDGAEARWHDQDAAKRKTERAGAVAGASAGGVEKKPKRLRKVFASQADAKAAAEAEAKRIARGSAELDYTFALGRPDIYPDRPATVRGFKPEVDRQKWLVAEATHTLDANGLGTKVKLEAAG
jgi:hypothetical protein